MKSWTWHEHMINSGFLWYITLFSFGFQKNLKHFYEILTTWNLLKESAYIRWMRDLVLDLRDLLLELYCMITDIKILMNKTVDSAYDLHCLKIMYYLFLWDHHWPCRFSRQLLKLTIGWLEVNWYMQKLIFFSW